MVEGVKLGDVERTAGSRVSGAIIPKHGRGQLHPWQPGQSGNPGGVGGQLRSAASRPPINREGRADANRSPGQRRRSFAGSGGQLALGQGRRQGHGEHPEKEQGRRLDLSKLSLPELQFLLKLAKSGALQMTEALPAPMDGDAIEAEAK